MANPACYIKSSDTDRSCMINGHTALTGYVSYKTNCDMVEHQNEFRKDKIEKDVKKFNDGKGLDMDMTKPLEVEYEDKWFNWKGYLAYHVYLGRNQLKNKDPLGDVIKQLERSGRDRFLMVCSAKELQYDTEDEDNKTPLKKD